MDRSEGEKPSRETAVSSLNRREAARSEQERHDNGNIKRKAAKRRPFVFYVVQLRGSHQSPAQRGDKQNASDVTSEKIMPPIGWHDFFLLDVVWVKMKKLHCFLQSLHINGFAEPSI